MTRLSVNVNKIATLRNARGGNNPNLIQVVKDCEKFGAQGITVHPRTDERHITLLDVYEISKIVKDFEKELSCNIIIKDFKYFVYLPFMLTALA